MRRYDEPIDVRSGRIGGGVSGLDADELAAYPEGPAQFVWRSRLWRVLGVQHRWIESGAWWNGPAVKAARGDDAVSGRTVERPDGPGTSDEDDGDLLREREVWRVEAANGREGSRGIYDLVHAWADGSWQLRAVID